MGLNEKPQEQARIRIGSYGGPQGGISLSGLKPEEIEIMRAAMLGLSWVRVGTDGRLETMSAVQYLKGPAEDESMLPFWRPVTVGDHNYALQLELFDEEQLRTAFSPHITIQSLCGYDYTAENYKIEAEKLERYGFHCLRSRRGNDGHYWEIWYLPGLWAAKDDLKLAIEWERKVKDRDEDDFILFEPEVTHSKRLEKDHLSAALEFLRRNCSFGTCDASVQRLAMVMRD